MEKHGVDNIPITQSKETEKLKECMRTFSEQIEKSPANILLKDI